MDIFGGRFPADHSISWPVSVQSSQRPPAGSPTLAPLHSGTARGGSVSSPFQPHALVWGRWLMARACPGGLWKVLRPECVWASTSRPLACSPLSSLPASWMWDLQWDHIQVDHFCQISSWLTSWPSQAMPAGGLTVRGRRLSPGLREQRQRILSAENFCFLLWTSISSGDDPFPPCEYPVPSLPFYYYGETNMT